MECSRVMEGVLGGDKGMVKCNFYENSKTAHGSRAREVMKGWESD